MNLRIIPILVVLLIMPFSAKAEPQILIRLYKADPAAPQGFTETYKWRIGKSDEWRRFEYIIAKSPNAEQNDVSPFVKKPEELLILSIKDIDGITGRDYYLSKDGIMITNIFARQSYFEDKKNFLKFLREEITNHTSQEAFPGEKISITSKGIVARYQINQDLPNPSWWVNTQENVNLYDSFMRKIPRLASGRFSRGDPFNEKGNFILVLNYPKAPGKFATVGRYGIRISDTDSDNSFFVDEKNYYKYFYDLTQESIRTKSDVLQKDKESEERGNF